jgi:hypothetical protein
VLLSLLLLFAPDAVSLLVHPIPGEGVLAFSMISYMAGSASFRWEASNCCSATLSAGADSGATGVDPSRTFCWLSTFSDDTHRLNGAPLC